MEVRGVLFVIETEEKKWNLTFHLDHNNALCLSQRGDQRSRKKTLRKSRKNNNNKQVTKP